MAGYVNPVPTFNLTQLLSPTEFRPAKATVITLQIACRLFGWSLEGMGTGKPDWSVSSNVPYQGHWRSGGQVQCSGGAVP